MNDDRNRAPIPPITRAQCTPDSGKNKVPNSTDSATKTGETVSFSDRKPTYAVYKTLLPRHNPYPVVLGSGKPARRLEMLEYESI